MTYYLARKNGFGREQALQLAGATQYVGKRPVPDADGYPSKSRFTRMGRRSPGRFLFMMSSYLVVKGRRMMRLGADIGPVTKSG
jgi:hypothetical protein